MEGNIFVLFLAIGLACLLAVAILVYLFASTPSRKDRPAPKRAGSSLFVRENEVTGYLEVDGQRIRTFNPGTLVVGELVSITFYNNFNHPIKITDIELNGVSIFSYANVGTPYRSQADYAIQVLKQTANQGTISRDLVHAVERVILDVDALNEHIEAKRIKQKQRDTGHDDFVWVG